MPIRILIADDIAITRRQVRAFLQRVANWEVCGEAADGLDAIAKTRELTGCRAPRPCYAPHERARSRTRNQKTREASPNPTVHDIPHTAAYTGCPQDWNWRGDRKG